MVVKKDLIEKVARSICISRGEDPLDTYLDGHGVTADYPLWCAYIDQAKAVVALCRDSILDEVLIMVGDEAAYFDDAGAKAAARIIWKLALLKESGK